MAVPLPPGTCCRSWTPRSFRPKLLLPRVKALQATVEKVALCQLGIRQGNIEDSLVDPCEAQGPSFDSDGYEQPTPPLRVLMQDPSLQDGIWGSHRCWLIPRSHHPLPHNSCFAYVAEGAVHEVAGGGLVGHHGVSDLGGVCQADTLGNHALSCFHGFGVHLGPA